MKEIQVKSLTHHNNQIVRLLFEDRFVSEMAKQGLPRVLCPCDGPHTRGSVHGALAAPSQKVSLATLKTREEVNETRLFP